MKCGIHIKASLLLAGGLLLAHTHAWAQAAPSQPMPITIKTDDAPPPLPPVDVPAAVAPIAPATAPQPPDTDLISVLTPKTPAPVTLTPTTPGEPVFHSIMFPAEQMEAMNQAAEDYLNSAGSSELENAGKDLAALLLQRRFYLSSIVYHSPIDWSVWLHDKQFTSTNPQDDDIYVQNVSPKEVTFVWKPRQFSFYNRRKVQVSDPRISVDPAGGTLTFSLFPNQTFLPATMRIVEGWIGEQQLNTILLPLLPSELPKVIAPSNLPKAPPTSRTLDGLPVAPLPSVPTLGLKNSPSNPPADDLILKK